MLRYYNAILITVCICYVVYSMLSDPWSYLISVTALWAMWGSY